MVNVFLCKLYVSISVDVLSTQCFVDKILLVPIFLEWLNSLLGLVNKALQKGSVRIEIFYLIYEYMYCRALLWSPTRNTRLVFAGWEILRSDSLYPIAQATISKSKWHLSDKVLAHFQAVQTRLQASRPVHQALGLS